MKRENGPSEAATLWEVVALPDPSGRRRWLLALAVVSLVVAAGAILAWRSEPTVADWAAAIALRIHNELDDDRSVTLEPAIEPVAPPPPAPSPVPPAPASRAEAAPRASHPRAARSSAPGPAKAQALAGQAPAEAPVDFADLAFVTGTSATAGFGRVSGSGTREGGEGRNGKAGQDGIETSDGKGAALARAVTLSEDAWDCPWPSSADEHERDEAEVDLSVEVNPDGRVAHVRILRDPGFGFGAAARACALHTPFAPALDHRGQPVIAWSPTIRVIFRR
jgi:protein TonB